MDSARVTKLLQNELLTIENAIKSGTTKAEYKKTEYIYLLMLSDDLISICDRL